MDQGRNGKVSKTSVREDCTAEVTAAHRDMAKVLNRDPLPTSIVNCEHIAVVQKHVAKKVTE